jgi:hypothetical protein
VGDLTDLVENPLLLALEAEEPAQDNECDDVGVWTFYNFATVKGYVTVSWLGESNGYYSMSVDHAFQKQ